MKRGKKGVATRIKGGIKRGFKSFISGSWLGESFVVRHLPSLVWVVMLTVVYIANTFHDKSLYNDINRYNRNISTLSVTASTNRATMISKTKESIIIQMIKDRGINIKEIETPPIVIK